MNRRKSGMGKTIIFLVLLVAVIGACFFLAQKKSRSRAEEKARIASSVTEAQKLVMMSIEDNYPITAREVLKLYNRILQCIYNEDLTDTQIESLLEQLRLIFDDEFLENNPLEQQLDALILEVGEYGMLARSIKKCEIETAKNASEWVNEKGSFTSLCVIYTVQEDKNIGRFGERFLLRKDENGRWKILGWETEELSQIY